MLQTCEEELLTITIQDYTTKQITTWGVKPFVVKQQNVTYIRCLDELDLLNKFITYWENEPPEVITGLEHSTVRYPIHLWTPS